MIFTFGIFDRALDIIGLVSLLYWTIKATIWWHNKRKV